MVARRPWRALILAFPLLALTAGDSGSVAAAVGHDADARTRAVVAAATAFLETIPVAQRGRVQFVFAPEKTAAAARFARQGGTGSGQPGGGPAGGFVGERYGQAVWSNYPVSDVPRPGLRLGALDPAQRAAAMRLLRTMLSPAGYRTVLAIMGSDQALADRGQNFAAGRDVYTIALFGAPRIDAPWMVAFGGHHLGLNIVVAGRHGIMTPTLMGAQPAVYTEQGRTVRVLAEENDRAFALLDALDPGQRKRAILPYAIGDLVLGPGHAGETIVPEGLRAADMNPHQKALLRRLIAVWAGVLDRAYTGPRMAEIAAGLDDTWFAWSGPTTHQPGRNGAAYYRVQGPKLVIEFSPQGVGGDPSMHVHTIYRDPTNDYGVAYTLR